MAPDWHKAAHLPLHPVDKPPYSVEIEGVEKKPGETIPRRNARFADGLRKTPFPEVTTVYELVKRSAQVYPNHRAMGSRKIIKHHKETKKIDKNVDGEIVKVDKTWQFFELSGYTYITYKEYLQLVHDLGSGLRSLEFADDAKVHFFATTSVSWMSLSHACASQSIQIATAYDTLGEKGVEHTLLQTNAAAMFVDPHLLKTASGPLKKSNVKYVIVNEDCIFTEGGEIEAFKEANPQFTVITYKELVQRGKENAFEPRPPKPEEVFAIMYTSGTGGEPKGVCVRHESLVAGVTGLYHNVEFSVSDDECILAYLPLAHAIEMALENLVLLIGGTLGYGSPRTLSDTSVRNCAGDMREFKPTVLCGVPQVWETIKKGIMGKVEGSSGLVKNLFWGAYSYKNFMIRNKLPLASVLDGIVFGKVKELTGGRLRFTFNGGSPISANTKNFISMVMAPMIGGYGLTETVANGALGSPLQYAGDTLGAPPPAVEVKLVALPDIGYDTDGNNPQGEIWIRGTPVTKEYFQNPEETAKAITEDGWFKTGDIGEWTADGHLRIIDRAKNLVKLAGGEYIALEKLETVYRGSQLVLNIMVEASPEHSRPLAVITPVEAVLAEKAKEIGVDAHSMHHNDKIRKIVLKDLQNLAKQSGLVGMEIVANVVITDEEWTPQNGLVTATQKLNRRAVREKYGKEIKEGFSKM
ncbi:hypothetical protein NLU13_7805 [Sarocladium strictum]|uniref:AMP-dependent synthetase/ligase domain-containing protein n=1 Tax=Sarocladium strictum TaxID=5046 RepID=A0AA39GEZ5_SARSR|nr:hypothetical protein NLU13_7805 [Sarocladium strictum]